MIYVDDFRAIARVGRIQARWSHLMAFPPNDQKLLDFGASIGLKPEWIQYGTWAHFDVTDSKRQAALDEGAVPMSIDEFYALSKKYAHLKPKRNR